MRPEPVFTPGAHDDVFTAAAYYGDYDPRLGVAFLDEVERAAFPTGSSSPRARQPSQTSSLQLWIFAKTPTLSGAPTFART